MSATLDPELLINYFHKESLRSRHIPLIVSQTILHNVQEFYLDEIKNVLGIQVDEVFDQIIFFLFKTNKLILKCSTVVLF